MPDEEELRISQLVSRWTLLFRAHGPDKAAAREAMAELLPRYCTAIHRYVEGTLRDETAADEVCQEFALRFLRGDFRHAKPERGRFRDYVKAAVIHLLGEYQKRRQAAERMVPFDSQLFVQAPVPGGSAEIQFEALWKKSLLDRAWAGLERDSVEGRLLHYEVLRLKADTPALRSAEIAAELARRHGRPFTPANARQLLHRARERYVELLWHEVAESLPSNDPAEIRAELAELGLLAYFRPAGRPAAGD